MREKFICAHFATSSHCKIDSKAHFFTAPPPLLFRSKISVFPTFPRFRLNFRRFFEECARFKPDFGRFFEEYFAFLPPPTAFSIHAPPSSSLLPHFLSHSSPLFHLPPQVNARTRAPSRITCVRVHPPLPARQEVFVYCLHRFTHSSQSAVHQCVRCEGKREKAFTKILNHLKIKTLDKTPDFIHRKLHLITAVNPTIPTVNLKTKSLHPLRTVPQPFATYG